MAGMSDVTTWKNDRYQFSIVHLDAECISNNTNSDSVVYGSGGGVTIAGYGSSSSSVSTYIQRHSEMWLRSDSGDLQLVSHMQFAPDDENSRKRAESLQIPAVAGQKFHIVKIDMSLVTSEGAVTILLLHNSNTNTSFMYRAESTSPSSCELKKSMGTADILYSIRSAFCDAKSSAELATVRKVAPFWFKVYGAASVAALVVGLVAHPVFFLGLCMIGGGVSISRHLNKDLWVDHRRCLGELSEELERRLSATQVFLSLPSAT